MKRQEWHGVRDRTGWGSGPWDDEPDKRQWEDAATRLPCLIVRSRFGGLCGYVGTTEGHPAFGRHYDEVPASVHGGLTYSGFCREGDESATICHVVETGEKDRVWWLGFDCGHAFDLSPGMLRFSEPYEGEVYRDISYVEGEVEGLASQLFAMAKCGRLEKQESSK